MHISNKILNGGNVYNFMTYGMGRWVRKIYGLHGERNHLWVD